MNTAPFVRVIVPNGAEWSNFGQIKLYEKWNSDNATLV